MKNVLKYALAATLTLGFATFFLPGNALAREYNSAGDSVFASAGISDATGTVTTVTTAGTYVTVKTAAPMVAGETDGSGCITYTLASNSFTIAASCGVGEILLRACLNDVVGANNAVVLGAWHRVRAGATTVASPIVRNTYAASAVRGNLGCVEKIVSASLSDTYDFRYDSGSNGDTVTTRAANFYVIKLQSL